VSAFANELTEDSESEEWMMTGMAVRMALDLGLHLVSLRKDPSDIRLLPMISHPTNNVSIVSHFGLSSSSILLYPLAQVEKQLSA
jgi:hypothetical protein